MEALHKKGYISDPRGRAESVCLTETGMVSAKELAKPSTNGKKPAGAGSFAADSRHGLPSGCFVSLSTDHGIRLLAGSCRPFASVRDRPVWRRENLAWYPCKPNPVFTRGMQIDPCQKACSASAHTLLVLTGPCLAIACKSW